MGVGVGIGVGVDGIASDDPQLIKINKNMPSKLLLKLFIISLITLMDLLN
jgi:hypothetical protein